MEFYKLKKCLQSVKKQHGFVAVLNYSKEIKKIFSYNPGANNFFYTSDKLARGVFTNWSQCAKIQDNKQKNSLLNIATKKPDLAIVFAPFLDISFIKECQAEGILLFFILTKKEKTSVIPKNFHFFNISTFTAKQRFTFIRLTIRTAYEKVL